MGGQDLAVADLEFALEENIEGLKLHGGVCPFALAAAAMLSSAMRDGRYMDLADSEYSDKGSKTLLKII